MSLKGYIDWQVNRSSFKQNSQQGAVNRLTQPITANSGTAKVLSITNGQYNVEMADGTFRTIDPNGVRGVGPNGIIFLSGTLQIF